MSFRRRLKHKRPPAGWEKIEDAIEDFEAQMRDIVADGHEGERRAALSWKVHRVHWEKNRFIYDLMYVRKVMSRELFDWLVREKVADGALIAKWRKPGYEFLCSMLAIQRGGTNFGTTALCRVPLRQRAEAQRVCPSVQTGCVSCASCDAGKRDGPIWWDMLDDDDDDDEEEGGGGGGGGREEERRNSGGGAATTATAATAADEEAGEEQGEPAAKRSKPSAGDKGGGGDGDEIEERGQEEDDDDDDDDDEEEELDDDVKARLEALKKGGGGGGSGE